MSVLNLMEEDVGMDYARSVLQLASDTLSKTKEALKATQEYQIYYNMYKYEGYRAALEEKANEVFGLMPEWLAYQDADKFLKHAQAQLAKYQMRRTNVFRNGWSLSAWM